MNVRIRRLGIQLGVAAAALAVVYFLASASIATIDRPLPERAAISGSGALDGKAFAGTIGPVAERSVEDRFVFADGKFLSEECRRLCNYPARAYFTRESDGGIEFYSETRCPGQNSRIVWRGRVEGTSITGVSIWQSRRWYWSVERELAFSGELSESGPAVALNE